jgi:protein TonB
MLERRAAGPTGAQLGAIPLPPSSADRFGHALLVALVAHLAVVFGVSFSPAPRPEPGRNTLDVVLVASRSEEAPEKADFLAQANQDGGGEAERPERPSAPLVAPATTPEAVLPAAVPPPPPEPVPERSAPERAVLTQDVSDRSVPVEVAERKDPEPSAARPPREAKPRPQRPREVPSADVLVARSLEMASLNAEINRKLKAYAERPVRKFINARTREYKYAAYMEAWRAKVERVGNLNYPDEARRQKLAGNLLLDVALNPDGSVNDIQLRRSSGHKVLDDAAIRIVRLAAPFAPFPRDIEEEVDILHIERTWQFLDGAQLTAR